MHRDVLTARSAIGRVSHVRFRFPGALNACPQEHAQTSIQECKMNRDG